MVAEKESSIAQFESIVEQKAVIEQAQKPLLQELNEIKKQIGAFDGQRQEAQVRACLPCLIVSKTIISRLQARVAQAAEQRLTAQHDRNHWGKKLVDEEKKVREAKELLNTVQQEFEASLRKHITRQLLTALAFRSGQRKQNCTVLAFLILGRSKSSSAT